MLPSSSTTPGNDGDSQSSAPIPSIASDPVLDTPARRTNALLDESPSDRAQQENLLKQAEADTEAVWKMPPDTPQHGRAGQGGDADARLPTANKRPLNGR
ncbi:hypothetical protein JCM17960_25480 [Magnetospira thiophila]